MGRDQRRESVGPVRADAEPPHLLFTQSCGLMRVLRSIVEVLVPAMLHAWQDFAFRSSITLQLISDDHPRRVLQPFEKLAKKSLGCLFIALALDQDIEYVSVLIDSSPQIMPLPTNTEKNLIPVPFLATARTTMAQFIGIRLAKLETPLPNCFIGHGDASLCVVRSSTSRKLSEKRKYSHTAWLIISEGKRNPL